ncbi:hypothetical protein D9C73_023820 [Collichthys lucidus]|uniref:Uncharacterized protein n=1 Tax=Collichthys lucidus TaxID=240159 RepID=A0A4V6ASV0_COLLU|nr:hypothetical protein D9C73_023820 [Collichthys lucidus]
MVADQAESYTLSLMSVDARPTVTISTPESSTVAAQPLPRLSIGRKTLVAAAVGVMLVLVLVVLIPVLVSSARARLAQVCTQEQIQQPQAYRWTMTRIWVITALAHRCLLTVLMAHKANQDVRASLDPQDHLESQAHLDPRDHREIVWTLCGLGF